MESQDIATRAVDGLWFPDHNLVLQAENRLFRVSGGILAARSSVFKDMLFLPQPETQPLIDGCPIVILHDSGIDAEYFLRALFDSSFFERPPAGTEFAIVAGVLRLSTKYDVEYLRRRALLHLASSLPRTLKEFDELSDTRTFDIYHKQFSRLVLVHDMGLTWALPVALYSASCCSVAQIMDGRGGEETLPLHLQRTCLIARASLALTQQHESYRYLRTPADDCISPVNCQRRRTGLLNSLTTLQRVDPVVIRLPGNIATTFCEACFNKATETLQTARQNVFDSIPTLFGLPSWEELNAARAQDLA
ncbi:hypothetical protein C8R43DRAFT_885012 [Mycena crocata]|nr:hypothetical protein C8R43DRAFT_885012 [Mycena crocata]